MFKEILNNGVLSAIEVAVLMVQVKLLSCIFFADVLCSYRKDDDFRIMARCLECPQHARFIREMDEEEDKFFAEVEKIRKYGYPKGFREGEF